MNLDDEELKATRKTNGTDAKLVFSKNVIVEKIYENEQFLSTKLRDEDAEQYEYLRGKLSVLNAIKEGDLSKI